MGTYQNIQNKRRRKKEERAFLEKVKASAQAAFEKDMEDFFAAHPCTLEDLRKCQEVFS